MKCCLAVYDYIVCEDEKSVYLVTIPPGGRETERAAWLQASEVISLTRLYGCMYAKTQLNAVISRMHRFYH